MKTNLRVLSLGAGVQSSTLALMIEKGEIPMVEAAIFADTGGNPRSYTNGWIGWKNNYLILCNESAEEI